MASLRCDDDGRKPGRAEDCCNDQVTHKAPPSRRIKPGIALGFLDLPQRSGGIAKNFVLLET